MMQQFEAAKARCPGALVLFRMGDFYELFGTDAHEAGRLLDLTVTSREKGPDAMPMAGFPHHQLDVHLAKLVKVGRHVAICEQIDDPKTTKGLLRREVTRIITPGIVSDESLLDPARKTYLLSLLPLASVATLASVPLIGLAWIDVSAGHFLAAVVSCDDVAEHLMRLNPAECLCAQRDRDTVAALLQSAGWNRVLTSRPDWWFENATADDAIAKLLGHKRLEGLGFELPQDQAGIAAAGAILAYLAENEPRAIDRIESLAVWRPGQRMEIDEATRRSLELVHVTATGRRDGSLAGVLDRTQSPMGSRLLVEWIFAPLVDQAAIDLRLDAVAEIKANPSLSKQLIEQLTGVGDLERLTSRVMSGRAGPRDLERIGHATAILPDVITMLSGCNGLLADLRNTLDPCTDICQRIATTLRDGCPIVARDGGFIRPQFDPQYDELVEMASGGKAWITRYQAEQIERTGIASLKVGFNRVFGFFLEVSRLHAAKIPTDYVRKQTVKNAERYTTPQLDQRQREVLGAEDESLRRELELLEELRSFVAEHRSRLDRVTDILATLDVLVSLAEVAGARGWVRPEITTDDALIITGGRHPILEELLPAGTLVANDLSLRSRDPTCQTAAADPTILLVTGPNMGGKSTFIRQAALIAVMAQAGSFVPATFARVGIVDRLFARIGAGDDLARGASTFLLEMAQTARILNRSTQRSLVILDEVGRGTSTYDGLAIAQAVVEHLHSTIGCRTLFATHYLQLAALDKLSGVSNVQVLVKQHRDQLVFLHQVVPGAADKSWGVHVAQLAGVPADVIDRARSLLLEFEGNETAVVVSPPPPPAKAKRPAATDQLSLFE